MRELDATLLRPMVDGVGAAGNDEARAVDPGHGTLLSLRTVKSVLTLAVAVRRKLLHSAPAGGADGAGSVDASAGAGAPAQAAASAAAAVETTALVMALHLIIGPRLQPGQDQAWQALVSKHFEVDAGAPLMDRAVAQSARLREWSSLRQYLGTQVRVALMRRDLQPLPFLVARAVDL